MKALIAPLAILSMLFTTGASKAQTQTTFLIDTESTYTYKLGFISVPDCDLNDDQQCDFSIEGSFTLIESGEEAFIVDANLILTSDGTELPIDSLATSGGVEDWLEGRVLELLPTASPGSMYIDTLFPGFAVTVIEDTAMLSGGFDHTFRDGNGIGFAVQAFAVPEPATLVLLLGSAAVSGRIRFRR